MTKAYLKPVIEAALFITSEPLTVDRLQQLFLPDDELSADEIKQVLTDIEADYKERGVELLHVASGYRFQAKPAYASWLQKLWEKKPPRFSRALLETLALIAYRQPITRGEIEQVRGVAVSSNIMKILQEREWIKVIGRRDVPGKPALFGTTKQFLDYFNLKSLSHLPPLEEIADMDQIEKKLAEQLSFSITKTPNDQETESVNLAEQTDEESQSEKQLITIEETN